MKSWVIYVAAALGFVIYGAATQVDRDSAGNIVGEGSVDAFNVRVGDCFDDTNTYAEEVSSLPGVPCDEPHDNETYAVFDVSFDEYTGDEAMGELAHNSCLERFDAFAGIDYESSSLDIISMYPTAESWLQKDRSIVCAVYDMDANKLVGSVQGKGL